MDTANRIQTRLRPARWLPGAGISLTLLILAGTVVYGTLALRHRIQRQIISRDAEVLYGVAQMIQVTAAQNSELGSQPDQIPDQTALALRISELNRFNGVIAARIFSTNGAFASAIPVNVVETTLTTEELAILRHLRPVGRFKPAVPLADLFEFGTTRVAKDQLAPLLEILVPIHAQNQPEPAGLIQFIMDGQRIASQFAALDRTLAWQSTLVFGTGSIIVLAMLLWAFHRLQRVNRVLQERTADLTQANQDLALAARASAVGAITAHLVHGLSNPLAGLEELLAESGDRRPEDSQRDLVTATRQVRTMVADILRMLGEERATDRYEVSLEEMAGLALAKAADLARSRQVTLRSAVDARGALPNREGNLTLLILDNLLRNAAQATPTGGTVQLLIKSDDLSVTFEVIDQGPGLPPETRASLFRPQRSTKSGGHGIGLAICRQLANHLSATVELKTTGPTGSTFVLRLPLKQVRHPSQSHLITPLAKDPATQK